MEKIIARIVSGIIILEANVDETLGNIILDTGSAKSSFNSTYFKPMDSEIDNIKIVDDEDGKSVTKEITKGKQKFSKITIDEYVLNEYTVDVLDLSYVEKKIHQVDSTVKVLGTLGMDFIKNHVLTIDYRTNTIVIDDLIPSTDSIDISYSSKGLIVVSTLASGESLNMIMDSGASVCVIDTSLKDLFYKEVINEQMNLFRSGNFLALGTTYDNIMFITMNFEKLSDEGKISGIIGWPCLAKHIVTIDCKNDRIFIE